MKETCALPWTRAPGGYIRLPSFSSCSHLPFSGWPLYVHLGTPGEGEVACVLGGVCEGTVSLQDVETELSAEAMCNLEYSCM